MRSIIFPLLISSSLISGIAWAEDKRILDILLKKGIINRAEYQELLQEATEQEKPADQPEIVKPPVPPAQQPPKTRPSPIGSYKDLEKTEGGIEDLRKREYRGVFTTLDSILKHSERINLGLVALKVQYVADNTDRKPGTNPGTIDPATGLAAALPTRDENGFRVRAAEIYVTGRLTPWAIYYFETDFSSQSEIVLRSMYMQFKDMPFSRNFTYLNKIKIGQFREPFGIEQDTSQGLIDFINRAYYTDLAVGAVALRPGDPSLNPFGKTNATGFIQQYDIGIELSGKLPQLPWHPEYSVALINGAGRNFNDNNADKDISGRLIFAPLEGMRFYLAGYGGTAFFNGTPSGPLRNNTDVRKFRQGAMYTYIPPFLNDLVKFQGEYIEGYDNGFRRRTWYQYVLFRPIPFLPNFEPAYRYEQFTMDTNRPNSTLDRHTIGFNYYFHTNVKLTVNYEIKHDRNEGNPFVTAGGGGANPNNKNFFVTQMQFRY
jgi:hypothetical protein